MLNTKQNWGAFALLIAGCCLMVGCAHPVKISENWKAAAVGNTIDLESATRSWNEMKAGGTLSPADQDRYNRTVRTSIQQIGRNWSRNKESLSTLSTNKGPVQIAVDASTIRDVDKVDYLVPTEYINVKRGLRETVKVEGVGTSMVARRKPTPEDPLVGENGLWFPMTAVLDLDTPEQPVLRLFDPTRTSHLDFETHQFPLAANYSAFIARDFQDRQLQILSLQGVLRYQKFEDRMGIRRISTFSPEKEAVILVHGIYSSPATWNETVNELLADPYIREKYEFWTFGYPTGAPIPYLARAFRKSVNEMCAFREANGAVNPQTTVIGHSMGGLLSKTLTQSSGDENWNKVFNVPLESLDLSAGKKKVLRDMFYFEPHPHVDRVVFVSTPHRGSDLAEKPAIKLVSDLVQMPKALVTLSSDIFKMGSDILTPVGVKLTRENPSSIDQLRADSEFSNIFRAMPLNPTVEYYSIIGNNAPGRKSLMNSTDGVVPYRSSHLDGVVSEKVVKSEHGAHKTSAGIAEIVRILKLPR